MKFGPKRSAPLTRCTPVHSLPGRIRIQSQAMRYLKTEGEEFVSKIQEITGVSSVKLSRPTGNVLIQYDSDILRTDELLETTEYILSTYSVAVFKEHRAEKNMLMVSERRIQNEPVSELVTRLGVTGVSILFSLLRPQKAVAGFLARLLSFNSLTAISLSMPIISNGVSSLLNARRPNADTLSASAIIASILAGKGSSALTIIFLADLAELITAYSMERTRKAIRDMLSIGDETVWKLIDDDVVQTAREELSQGDTILVHTGEKISVDGEVIRGKALVDQSPITGEFMPVEKSEKETVYAGTLVKNGQIYVKAQRVGEDTSAGRIIRLVEDAAHQKAEVQGLADRISAQFIPVNFALAILVLAITRRVDRALNMLIIDYSCGVRLSTVTAISSAIASAARQGVLIKGGNYLEMLDSVKTLVLDKTGTVTTGKPDVTSIYPLAGDLNERQLMELAAAAEERSTHPMAFAIMDYTRRHGLKIPKHGELNTVLGRGVETKVGGKSIRVGNRRFMQQHQVQLDGVHEVLMRLARRGEQVLFISRENELLGLVGVQDRLRDNMKKALNRLRNEGFDDIILLTGDVEQQAEVVAERIRVDSFQAEVLPETKSESILKLQSRGVPVIMVGDGINDAPALAFADVGISMGGTRTDIAMEAADITIIHDDPLMIPGVIRMAKKTMGIVQQNFAASIGINSVGLILSTLGLLPVFWGAVLHNATTVGVVLNSARLLIHELEER